MNYKPENTTIAVIGGGNIGTQFACVCASKGYKVNIYTSRPELFSRQLEIVDEYGKITTGIINSVSSDLERTVVGCDVVFVTYPAAFLRDFSRQLIRYVEKEMVVFMLPGTGGAEFAFRECINKGAILAGVQRVPSVARLEQYGKRVRCEGVRQELFLASIPSAYSIELSEFISSLWSIPCSPLPNYLNVTLTPSNPILHTTRLRTLFSDYHEGVIYDRNPLFYGEWSDEASRLLIACDQELQCMLKKLDKFDLHYIRSLKQHYESDTPDLMTRKIRSINSLHNLLSPMKRVENGWVPDFKSRYFTADFSYGLAIIEEFARLLNYAAPNIDETMSWYRSVTSDDRRFSFSEYGIHELEEIYRIY